MTFRWGRLLGAAASLAIAAGSSARAAIPVLQPIADMDTTMNVVRHDETVRKHVTATNSPTHYEATGLPPGVSFTQEFFQDGYDGVFYWEYGNLTGGAYTVTVTASNTDGTSAPVTFRWLVHPGMNDFIYTDGKYYSAGDVITFHTRFSAPVIVKGTPYLRLWGLAKKALYASGSGTDKLTFTYQVAADDPPTSNYYISDIEKGDGAITTVDGVSASLTDTYRGLSDPPGIYIVVPPVGSAYRRLVNLSSRAQVGADDGSGAFIAGFVVGGSSPKRFLLRAVGPSLAKLGISAPLANPTMQLFDGKGAMIVQNENWVPSDTDAAAAAVGAFALEPGSSDAAILVLLVPGPYTFRVLGNGGNGVALAEVYDATGQTAADDPALVNISSRGYVGTGEQVLIAGFVVTGDGPKRFLIRGVGPGLLPLGVGDAMADPTITIYHDGTSVVTNDNWGANDGSTTVTAADITSAGGSVGAFSLPAASKDSATIVTLPPGAYTAVMSGAHGSTGSGLVEVYALP